ncbi:MAG TPA: type IIL restriction-modification enzyme MmeI [Gallionella sp.]
MQKNLSGHSFGGQELLHNIKRWCLWLIDAQPSELRSLPAVMRRVEAVKKWREASNRETTKKLSLTPTSFAEIRQPTTDYVAVPTLSSERRMYIPMAFLPAEVIASNQLYILPDATLFHFGILTSAMHMAWVRYTCGRLESRYRYSAGIVYNNYPWPDEPTDKLRTAVEAAAQAVLDARAQFPQSSLADLYDPLTMPPALVKAHQALDRAVDACYRKAAFTNDAQRVEFLFERYQQLTSLLPAETAKPKRRKARTEGGA